MKLKISLDYDVDSKDLSEAMDELAERFAMENTTAENEFWGNATLEE
jgi:hypothetical protein